MNNYLPLLVQNESFSQPLSLQPLTPGDTLRREGGREGEPFPRNPPPIYISRGNLNPSFRNSYNNSTIPPPPPLPFHAWKPGRAMFISLFFFFLFSLSLSSPLLHPSRFLFLREHREPVVHPTSVYLSSLPNHHPVHHHPVPPPPPPPPFRTRGKPPPSNELRG